MNGPTTANRPGWLAVATAAAAAAGTIALWNKLPDGDPIRATLRTVPAVSAAFVGLAAWIERAGGRRLATGPSWVEASALTAIVVAIVTRGLWLPVESRALDRALVAAWALVVLHRFLRTLVAARPILSRPGARPPHPVFFLLPALVYVALLPWQAEARRPDGDEPYYLLITHSLAYDGDIDLANNYRDGSDVAVVGRELAPQPGDPVGSEGELYSRHNSMLPLLLAPAYRWLGVRGALGTMALFAGGMAWGFLAVGRRYFSDMLGALLLAYTVLVVSAPLLVYSYQVWIEVPAGVLLLGGLAAVHSLETGEGSSLRKRLALVAVVIALPLLKARLVLFSIAILALATLRSPTRRKLAPVAGLLVALTALGLAVNAVLFGNPLKYHDAATLLATLREPAAYVRGLVGLFFDSAFGLFASAPIWMLVIPGGVAVWHRHRRLAVDLSLLSVPYLFLVAPRLEWYGGWAPPFRYAIAILPLIALTLVPALAARHRRGVAIASTTLVILSAVTTVVALVEPTTTYSFADGRSRVLDALTQTSGLDHARFFPSYVRPRLASWLWPIAIPPLLVAIWHFSGARRRSTRATATAAATVALGLALLLVVAAAKRPTRTVEFEDPYLKRDGGKLYPDRWRPARAAYHGGWVLRAGDLVAVDPVPGGNGLDLAIDLRGPGPRAGQTTLVVSQGDRPLCRIPIPTTASWTRLDCHRAEWLPDAGPMTLHLEPSDLHLDRPPRVILDRASLTWTR